MAYIILYANNSYYKDSKIINNENEVEIDRVLRLLGLPSSLIGLELRVYNTEYNMIHINNSFNSDTLGFLNTTNVEDPNNINNNKILNTVHDMTWNSISDYIDNNIYQYQPVWDTYADAYNYIASLGLYM